MEHLDAEAIRPVLHEFEVLPTGTSRFLNEQQYGLSAIAGAVVHVIGVVAGYRNDSLLSANVAVEGARPTGPSYLRTAGWQTSVILRSISGHPNGVQASSPGQRPGAACPAEIFVAGAREETLRPDSRIPAALPSYPFVFQGLRPWL